MKRRPRSQPWELQKLLPGMTANVELIIEERKDALVIPNRALRFTPPEYLFDRDTLRDMRTQAQDDDERIVWRETQNGNVEPLIIAVGISDGFVTEVTGSDLSDDDRVAITIDRANDASFGPPGPGRRGGPM